MFGYAEHILYVDLSSGNIKKEPLDMDLAVKFMGGEGYNLKLMYDNMKAGTDPLAADNPFVVGTGVFSGTLFPGAAKVVGTSRFPFEASADHKYYVTTAIGGSLKFGFIRPTSTSEYEDGRVAV
jgi:aldehyde:ferredoxin oxidoreductase